MAEFTHARFGKCVLAEVNQGQLEAWQSEVKDTVGGPMAVWYGATVKAAIKAKILVEPVMSDEQIAAAKPGMIHWLANCVAEVINEASNIDPLS